MTHHYALRYVRYTYHSKPEQQIFNWKVRSRRVGVRIVPLCLYFQSARVLQEVTDRGNHLHHAPSRVPVRQLQHLQISHLLHHGLRKPRALLWQ